MSRIGKMPVQLPQGVKAVVQSGSLLVEGPKGKLTMKLPADIDLSVDAQTLQATRKSEAKSVKAKHGLVRSLAANMVKGVSTGFERKLLINGVGYRAAVKGKFLDLTLGFSHPVNYPIPEGITIKVEGNTTIVLSGSDKALLGETAAQIRRIRPPEPYQGKGIKYAEETIRRKAGKAAGK